MKKYYVVTDELTPVAEGVIFDNGVAVTAWPLPYASVQVHLSETTMHYVHETLGRRRVLFQAADPAADARQA